MDDKTRTIHDAVMREAERMVSLPFLGIRVLEDKAEKAGHPLTTEERKTVEQRLAEFEARSKEGPIEEESLLMLTRGELPDLILEEADLKRAAELSERVIAGFPDVIEGAIPKHAAAMYQTVLADWQRHLSGQKVARQGFVERLEEVWGEALDRLWLLVTIAKEMGEEMAAALGRDAGRTTRLLFRLHARACQIGEEVVTLLRGGFADGAHARWRTLHEIAVVMFFVGEHGDDVAEKYEAHAAVESWKSAQHYQTYSARLGVTAFSDAQMAAMKKVYDESIVKYGKSFRGDYGWAAAALGSEWPNFGHIEAAVQLDHHRPLYRMAGHNVHANPKGVMFRLGLMRDNVLLAGPSNAGLADPGSDTAGSLTQATIALTRSRDEVLDDVLKANVLLLLSDDVSREFLKADELLCRREEQLQQAQREGK